MPETASEEDNIKFMLLLLKKDRGLGHSLQISLVVTWANLHLFSTKVFLFSPSCWGLHCVYPVPLYPLLVRSFGGVVLSKLTAGWWWVVSRVHCYKTQRRWRAFWIPMDPDHFAGFTPRSCFEPGTGSDKRNSNLNISDSSHCFMRTAEGQIPNFQRSVQLHFLRT